MKRGMKLLLFGLFSMLFLGIVSAQITRYSPQDIILRISGNTNAHGEIYSQNTSGYTNIYYSDIFGNTYAGSVTPANLRICSVSGSNRVLRLWANTNAHAQAPSFTAGTLYDIDVCYGDLVCTAVPGNNNCSTNYKEVVSLSANNNAHIENATANQYTGAGNSKICCLAPPPSISNSTWRYYDGTQIDPNARVCRNNHVIARVQTNNIADGTPLIFEFYDLDLLTRDPIANRTGYVQNNVAQIVLPLNDTGVQAALQSALGFPEAGNNLELIFEVRIPGDTETSYQIIYENNASLCSFDPPNAVISAPKHRGVYYADTEVNFTSGCTSQIGPPQTEWTITPQNGQAFTRTETTFNYTFTQAGQVNVKLKCTDPLGNFDINESQILVIASPYTLAYINKPSFNEIVYKSPPALGPYFPNEISFSASDSFVVNSSTACTLECLGGNCPNQTENSLMSCGSGGGPISITAQPIVSYSSLFFNWTFMDSDWTNEWAQYETGNGIYSGLVQYDDLSNSLRDKKIIVNVKHTSGASAQFERSFTLGRCLNNGNTYYSSELESNSTNEPNGKCKGGDEIALTADDCCPTGLRCMAGTSATNPLYSCQIPPGGPIIDCNDFTNQTACNGNQNPAIPQASYGEIPPACTELKCQWSNTTNSCGLNITTYANSSTTGACSSGPTAVIVSSCSYTTTVSACTGGKKTITYVSTGGPSCVRDPVTVLCGSLSFELGFFTLREFLLSVLLIGAIYLIFNFRKELARNEK